MNLKRPAWLNFERFIPLIWIFIYGCFYFSALTAWYKSWNPFIMLLYLRAPRKIDVALDRGSV